MDEEYQNSPDCPVKDLLSLIQQEDIEGIRQSLLDVIEKSYPNGEIYLYEQGYSLYDSKNKDFSPKLLACRSNENCLKKSEEILLSSSAESISFEGMNYLPSDKKTQVFTVEGERSSRGLLITINEQVIDEQYINILLEAYNHQVHLLRNKDTDSLTGIFNRQSFDSKLTKLHANLGFENRTQDNSSKYCFALLDIDFFKSVNDKFGHVYGDEVLILFSNMMKKTFRDIDMLFRYGGEEFAVLLNNVNLKQAESILNRFRNNIKKLKFPMGNTITVSIGFCEFTNQIPLSKVTEYADRALYYSKRHGRNKTSGYEDLLKQNKIQDTVINEGDIELF